MNILFDGLMTGTLYGLMAMGLSQMYGVSKTVNFAHGEMITFVMYAFVFGAGFGFSPLTIFVVILPIMAILGTALHHFCIAPLQHKNHYAQFVFMAALGVILRNVQALCFGEHAQGLPQNTLLTLESFSLTVLSSRELISLITVLIVVLCHKFLKYHPLGLQMRAVAENPENARLTGLHIPYIQCLSTGFSFLLITISGFFLLHFMDASPTLGTHLTLLSFIIVILGGLGSIMGAFFAGVFIGCVESLTAYYFDPTFKTWASFVMLIVFLILKPEGFSGKRAVGASR